MIIGHAGIQSFIFMGCYQVLQQLPSSGSHNILTHIQVGQSRCSISCVWQRVNIACKMVILDMHGAERWCVQHLQCMIQITGTTRVDI